MLYASAPIDPPLEVQGNPTYPSCSSSSPASFKLRFILAMAAVAPATDVLFASIEAKAVGEYYSPGLRSRFQLDATRPVAPAEPKHYANIGYEVNEEAFRRRGEARLAAGGLPTAVPSGWPTEVEGPLVWTSDSFPDESAYVYHLTDEDKTEIGEALEYFKS